MEEAALIADKIIAFIEAIKIPYRQEQIEGNSFLPGLCIDAGVLIIDREKLLYPGDILHEAGHIAVTLPKERPALQGNITDPMKQGDEMAVLVWSYLASVHIGIAPEIVFHPQGYKGSAQMLLENFANKNYIGSPLLIWMGMAAKTPSGDLNIIKWTR